MTSGGTVRDLFDAVSVKKQNKTKTMIIVRMINDHVDTKQSKFSQNPFEYIIEFNEKTCLLGTLRMDELNNS